MKQKLVYSARFKRDYVATSAVMIFLLIVAAELFLAVSIPLYVRREGVLAVEVRRLKLLDSFDATRRLGRRLELSDETAKIEQKLLMWNLNLLATYLRENSGKLSSEDIAELQDVVDESGRIVASLRNGGNFCQPAVIDSTACLDTIIAAQKEKK